MAVKIITPNTNIGPGSVQNSFIADGAVTADKIADGSITAAKIADGTVVAAELASDSVTTAKILDANVTEAKIADDAVTLAKISTTGASNEQVLTYNSTSGNIEWADNADIDVSNITDKMKITGASTALSPLLHLKTTNTGSMNGQLLLEDSNQPSVSIIGRENTPYDRYSLGFVMDPENNKPRTNVPGDGDTFAGDYQFSFSKKYADQDEIIMALNVFGAHNAFEINAFDDANGGVDAFGWTPLRFGGSQVSFNTNSTERLAFDDNGMHISGVPLILAEARGNSNFQIDYVGDSGTGDPDMRMFMHNIGDDRLINVMKAWDDGTNTDAVVSVGHILSVGNQTGVNSTNLLVLSDQTTALNEKGCFIGNGQINATTGATTMDGGIVLVGQGTDNRVEMRNKLRLLNASTTPTDPTPGDMFFNTTTNKFQGYDGTAWRNLH